MLWDRAFAAQQKSALAELRSAAGSLQAVLLTFLHTRIAGQEAGLLQGGAQLGVELQQGAGQAVADSASLAGTATADDVDDNVELALVLSQNERAVWFRTSSIASSLKSQQLRASEQHEHGQQPCSSAGGS